MSIDWRADAVMQRRLRVFGATALLVGMISAGILAGKRLSGMELPGCGADGGCAGAEASRWGKVAGWPLSYLGLAYFAALAAAGAGWRQAQPRWVVYALRLGALCSCGLILIMFAENLLCGYCLVTHAANLVLWLGTEFGYTLVAAGAPQVLLTTATFVLVSAVLAVGDYRRQKAADSLAERQLQETVNALRPSQAAAPAPQPPPLLFLERCRLGPANAAAGIVIFADMECAECRQAIAEARSLVRTYPRRVSFSLKHFPMCSACNKRVHGIHRNSCRCARVIETGGMLEGTGGFWAVVDWLSQQKGLFTDEELLSALPSLGFADVDKFLSVLNGREPLDHVLGDIANGADFRFEKLPLIVVNGVEFKAWRTGANSLGRLVEAALQKNDGTEREKDAVR